MAYLQDPQKRRGRLEKTIGSHATAPAGRSASGGLSHAPSTLDQPRNVDPERAASNSSFSHTGASQCGAENWRSRTGVPPDSGTGVTINKRSVPAWEEPSVSPLNESRVHVGVPGILLREG